MLVFSLNNQKVNLAQKLQFEMFVVFSSIFVWDAKVIFPYDFVAPLISLKST